MAVVYLALLVLVATTSLGADKPDCNTENFHGCMPEDKCAKEAIAHNLSCASVTSVCCGFRNNTKDPCPNVFGGVCTTVKPGELSKCRQPDAAKNTCSEGQHCCILTG